MGEWPHLLCSMEAGGPAGMRGGAFPEKEGPVGVQGGRGSNLSSTWCPHTPASSPSHGGDPPQAGEERVFPRPVPHLCCDDARGVPCDACGVPGCGSAAVSAAVQLLWPGLLLASPAPPPRVHSLRGVSSLFMTWGGLLRSTVPTSLPKTKIQHPFQRESGWRPGLCDWLALPPLWFHGAGRVALQLCRSFLRIGASWHFL